MSAGDHGKYAKYSNVPLVIGTLVSRKFATLWELQTVYGLEDAYDMLEIGTIENYNASLE